MPFRKEEAALGLGMIETKRLLAQAAVAEEAGAREAESRGGRASALWGSG